MCRAHAAERPQGLAERRYGREGKGRDLRRPVRAPGGLRGRGTAPRPARDQRERAAPEQPQPATTPPPPHRSRSHLVLDPLRLPSSLQFSPHRIPHPLIQFSPPPLIQFSPPSTSHPLLHPILTPSSIQFSPPPPSNSHPPPPSNSSIQSTPHLHPLLSPHPSNSHPLKFPFLNLNNLHTNALAVRDIM